MGQFFLAHDVDDWFVTFAGDLAGPLGVEAQTIQPWHFGEEAFKATCLWLKGLPTLEATNRLTPPEKGTEAHKAWSFIHQATPGADRWKLRSTFFPGIADAMADQWGRTCPDHREPEQLQLAI